MRLSIVLLTCAACGGGTARAPSAPGPAPGADRPLTPSEVGLPEVPVEDPHTPPLYRPTPGSPNAFYRRESCPPIRGCLLTREITADGVTTSYSCRPGSALRGFRSLRTLELSRLTVDDEEGTLSRGAVRLVLVRKLDAWRRCVAGVGTSAQIQIRGAISAAGAAVAAEVRGVEEAAASCLGREIAEAAFPSASAPTSYELTLALDVTSPTTVPPLQCQ